MFSSIPSIITFITTFLMITSAEASPAMKSNGYSNRIILIRHGEKGFRPGHADSQSHFWPGPLGKPPSGLNEQGRIRAQYIREVFGEASEYDIGLIFAAPSEESSKETERTYATVAPLAEDLGLEIDISCANSPASCIKEKVEHFAKTSDEDILIAWKHRELKVIATELGAHNAIKHYPDERNDIIWIMQDGEIVEKRSMHCPGLDDGRVDEGDPDLDIDEKGGVSWLTSLWLVIKHLLNMVLGRF